MDINLLVAILGATVTFLGYYVTRYIERKKEIEFQIRAKKIPIYEEFFEFYFKVIFGSNGSNKGLTHNEMVNFFRKFNQKAIIWFPDEILKSYIDWKKELDFFSTNSSNENLKKLILTQENLMKQFRKDIGHKNKKIGVGGISSMYINDLDKLF